MGDRINGSTLPNPESKGDETTQPLAVKIIDGTSRFDRRTVCQDHPTTEKMRQPGNLKIVAKPSIPGGERCDAAHDYVGGVMTDSNGREMYQVFRPKGDTLKDLTIAARMTTETTILEDCDGPGIPFQDDLGGALSIDPTKSVDGGSSLKIEPAGDAANIEWYDAGLGAGVWRGGSLMWTGGGFMNVELRSVRWKGETNPEPATPFLFNLEYDPNEGWPAGSFRVNNGDWQELVAGDDGGGPWLEGGYSQLALEDQDNDFVLYINVWNIPGGPQTEEIQVDQFSRGISFENAHGLHFFARAETSVSPLKPVSIFTSMVEFKDCFGTTVSVPFEPYQVGWNEFIIRVSDIVTSLVMSGIGQSGKDDDDDDDSGPLSIGDPPVFAWSNVTDIVFKFAGGYFGGDIHLDAIGIMEGAGPESLSSFLPGVSIELYDFGNTFPTHLNLPPGFGLGDGVKVYPDLCDGDDDAAAFAGYASGKFENQLIHFPHFKFGVDDPENTLTPDNYYVLRIKSTDFDLLPPVAMNQSVQMLGANDGEDRYLSGRALTSNDDGATFEEVGGGDPADLYFNYRQLADVYVDDIQFGESMPFSRLILFNDNDGFEPRTESSNSDNELDDQRNGGVLSVDYAHLRAALKNADGDILVEVSNSFSDFSGLGGWASTMLGDGDDSSFIFQMISMLSSGEQVPANVVALMMLAKTLKDMSRALENKKHELPLVTKGGGLEIHVSANASSVVAFMYAFGEMGPEGRLCNVKWTLFHEAADKNG